MPAYNFKAQFVSLIQSGAKTTTVRKVRKRPTLVGDRLYLYHGMRSKRCILVKTTTCAKVTPIAIYTSCCSGMVILGDTELNPKKISTLAARDGFQDISSFLGFFAENYGPNFAGELIEWVL